MKNLFKKSLLVLIGVLITSLTTQMWADPNTGHTINYPYFYYYNSGNWTNCAAIFGRQWTNQDWTDCWNLSNVTNTKLYYAELQTYWNNTYNEIAVLNVVKAGNDWKGEGSDIESRWGYATNGEHTDNVVKDYNLNYHETYLWDGVGASTITPVSSNQSTGYTGLNHSQTVKKYTATNGTTYSEASVNSGTVTISAYKMTGYNTASNASNSATLDEASETSASKDAAYTSTVTMTASANSGYVFMGWYADGNGGDPLETSTTYTYSAPYEAKTVYARFAPKYTVGSTLYLRVGSNWTASSPRFAAVFCNATTQTWVNCTAVSGATDFYSVTVPSGNWGCVIFCRMPGNNATNNWATRWTQTSDMFYTASSNKVFVPHNASTSGTVTGEWLIAGYESSNNGIKYVTTGDPVNWTFNGQSAQTTDLNTVTNLYLKEWFTYEHENRDVWTAKLDGSHADWKGINNSVINYNIHRTAVSPGAYTTIAKNWVVNEDWNGGYKKSKAGNNNQNINLLDCLGSGKYTMSFYYYDPDLHITSPTHTLKWTIGVPAMGTHTCTSDGSGDGQSGTPFTKSVGSNLTITVAGTQASADANSVLYVSFDGGEYTTTTTYTINSITSTKESITVKAKYRNATDNLDGTVYDFGTIYYQGTLVPSLAISSFTQDASTVTSANAGETVTINASRENAETAEITYEYSTDNSNWTTIGTTTSTTQSWTLPAATSTITYYVKTSMTYSATGYSDTKTFKVYGKKTIKVKDTNGWGANFKIHRWGGDRPSTSYPGETANISSAGGQWKQVVLYSSNTDFIFCNGESTEIADANKTENQTYASLTDNGCYEIESGSKAGLTLNSTLNCPAKPSVSASAATSLTNTTATINGNISSNGNDAIKDYGFYWGTSSTPGTKVSKGTSDKTGAISHNLTGLTAGTTYYYQAYATNGQGETKSTPVQSFVAPYSVTISTATGCSAITPGTGTQYIKVGDVITATAANGYEFSSWSVTDVTLSDPTTTDGVTRSTVTAASNGGTIQPVYTAKTYTGVTLDKNTGSSDGAYSVTYLDNKITVTTTPAKTGYHVDGYYAEAGTTTYIATAAGALQSGKSGYTDGSGRWNQAGGKKLYAKWAANTYTAANNIDKNGGDTDGQYTATYDATSIAINTAPTRTGYTLTGFHAYGRSANSLANSSGTLTASQSENGNGNRVLTDGSKQWIYDNTDAKIYADWSANPYTITFNADDASRVGTATNVQATVTVHFDNNDYKVSSTSVTTVAIPVLNGYTFGGYYTAVNGGGEQIVNASGAWQSSKTNYTDGSGKWIKAANTTLYAKWTEDMHTVSVVANDAYENSHGSVSTASVTAGIATKSAEITATPENKAWRFKHWVIASGISAADGYDTHSNPLKINATTDDITLIAYFEPRYALMGSLAEKNDPAGGMPSPTWNDESAADFEVVNFDAVDKAGGVDLRCTRTLEPNKTYKFQVYDREIKTPGAYNEHTRLGLSSETVLPTGESVELTVVNGSGDVRIQTVGRGDYTFKITKLSSDATYNRPTITVDRQESYVLNLGWGYSQDGGSTFTDSSVGGNVTATATESGTTVAIVNGQYVAAGGRIDLSAHAEVGYTFLGYYNGDGYNTRFSENANWYNENISTATTAYAKFQANAYAITFDATTNGGTLSGSNQNAIYNNTSIASCPVGVKEGYHFKGWYTASTDGELVIDASGNLQPSITVSETIWTDASSKWKKLSGATVYAQYEKAEITEITLSDAIVAPNTSITATPTISPTPTGTTGVCWELQYSNGTRVPSQPTFTPEEGNAVSFNAPAASATYILQAKLAKGSDCPADPEDVLSTRTTTFQVAGEHTVTIRYQDSEGRTLQASSSIEARPLDWTTAGDITPPTITGYTFDHWDAGDGVTINNGDSDPVTTTTASSIQIKATYDGTLTAVYNKKNMIFFNNTLGWSDVYVYFYSSDKYWVEDHIDGKGCGTGSDQNYEVDGSKAYYRGYHGHMTQIEGTNIWYYDYEAEHGAKDGGEIKGYDDVVFVETEQNNFNFFYNNKASCRGDFKHSLSMFVPLDNVTKTKNGTKYYNDGYWMNYPENTGYSLHIYDSKTYGSGSSMQVIPFEFNGDMKMPMTVKVELNANREYGYEIHRADGNVYGKNSKVLKINDSGDVTPETLTQNQRGGIQTSVAGDYEFTLDFGNNGGYHYLIGVHYPVAANDYRIVYTDEATWSKAAHTTGWYHPSRAIHKEEGSKDIVSFYVSKADGANASMKFQYASAIEPSTGVVTWTDVSSGTIDLSSITKSGVYNFHLSQDASSISVEKIEPYTGNYYIRTDCAGNSKWENFRTSDHQMTYSDYAEVNSGYSHYYTHWVTSGTNVKFVIANDYSQCITDTLSEDYGTVIADITAEGNDGAGSLNSASANIRFMWDQATNKISRAYIGGSTYISERFLVLEGDEKMFDEDGSALNISGLNSNEANLIDVQNFVYERTIQVNTQARAKLTAKYNNNIQYFKGSEGVFSEGTTIELLGGDASGKHTMRIVYDFKTNRLVTAYVPSGTIDDAIAINADLMIVREHQGAGQQLLFEEDGALTEVHTVYGVMRFNRWTLNNKETDGDHDPVGDPKSAYERGLYWISFPFDVNLSDVFGFGTYGTHWIIMEYDGAARATEGYWADSEGFWKYVTNRNGKVLEAGKGYVLALDLDLMRYNDDSFWKNNIEQVELFFPSAAAVNNIQATNVTTTVDSHECTIDRRTDKNSPDINKDRTRADSHWNIIGIPSYANYGSALKDGPTGSTIEWHTNPYTNNLPFLYEWNAVDNTYSVQSGTTYPFKAMHAYMVQYHGNLYWSLASATPPSIVARSTYAEKPESVEMRIELQQNEMKVDQTFVKLSNDENASVNFAFDEDLCKEFNANKANIYTIVENYLPVAGNTMPMSEQTTVVPVGVRIAADGDYTFSIPDGTEGIGVVLIDNIAGTRTNLGLMDYTVTLAQGQIDDRFLLEISPISQISTDVESISDDGLQVTGARKIMIDGLLYIVKDGKVFDAQGRRL